jgi:hypothetical protein
VAPPLHAQQQRIYQERQQDRWNGAHVQLEREAAPVALEMKKPSPPYESPMIAVTVTRPMVETAARRTPATISGPPAALRPATAAGGR